jgi:hypothetical protein
MFTGAAGSAFTADARLISEAIRAAMVRMQYSFRVVLLFILSSPRLV